jgi:hypothetical protein
LTPEPQGNNQLLFELASEFKEFNSAYQPVSPRDYQDEEKDWTRREGSEEFLDTNLYLSFPPPEKNTSVSLRKAPPIPTQEDELIRYEAEKPVLKSALKATPKLPMGPLDASIMDELNTLTGEIKSLRENLADMESSRTNSLSGSQNTMSEMKEICFDELATSTDDLSSYELSNTDDQENYNDDYREDFPSGSPLPDRYDENVLFTIDGDGSSPLQSLEKSIISCAGDDDDFIPRDHTLVQEFSLQDFDDELDKINLDNGLSFPPPPRTRIATPMKSKKKEIRFDLQSTPVSTRVVLDLF